MKTQPRLLQDAMLHLKQRKGASLAQLRKHLETNYEEKLNGSSKKLLTASLKGLVQTGKVKKLGNVYKLSSGGKEDDNDDTTIRRRRKRKFPLGYCKTHRFPHRAGSRRPRRRSTRPRRRRHHRRRHHRRVRRHHRHHRHHRRRSSHRRHHRRRHHRRHSHRRHHRRHH